MRVYRPAAPISEPAATALAAFNPLTRTLLWNRGITDAAAATSFLEPNYDLDRHDPFQLAGMEAAVTRVLAAIAAQERIVVYADYDCDGIPGAVVLADFFRMVGHAAVTYYIPHRHYEGFGLSAAAVEKIADQGADLIITVDCGTSDVAAVSTAGERGIDVIVTDHHEPAAETAPALAVVNPKIGDTYPFKDLCGAGVAFKLVEALIARGDFDLTPGTEKWLLDMVGVATVSDMVPLVGENRVLARYGLHVLRKSRRPGLQHLFKATRTSQRHLTEDDIGFTLGPRINAASRMDTPDDAFNMLAAQDEAEAGSYVTHLEHLNNERKGLVASMTKELKKRIGDMVELPDVLVLGSTDWRPSLVGLAANSLSETYRRPAFIWGRDGNGAIKGSCRSDGVTSVVTLMNAVPELFHEHGGHHMSGGFTVRDEQIYSFPEALNGAYKALGTTAAVEEEVVIDATLTFDEVNATLTNTLATLAPYGMGNPKPLFSFADVVPARVEQFGKTKEHLKLTFEQNGRRTEALAFFSTPEAYRTLPEAGKSITLLAHVEQSFFMGRLQTRLRIVDIV